MSTEKETAVAANPAAETPSTEGKKASEKQKKNKKRQQKPKISATEKNIIARFASCGRCSYLMTTYRLSRKPSDFATAVTNIKDNWLTLTWDATMSKLVAHSYGVRFDIDSFFVEGCCPECRRVYVCNQDAQDDKPPYFRIHI